jgi:predicted NodU family carbamoyl transferase
MYLCLSLGHNSSAVLLREFHKPIGYEEERLTKKKSDSSFPLNSIKKIFSYVGDDARDQVQRIYISHWFDTFDPKTSENKYYSASLVRSLFPNAKIIDTQYNGTSHHEAHALSALAFYDYHEGDDFEGTVIAVIDGFGNGGEVASVYRTDGQRVILEDKVAGYSRSMGLLYQYAAKAVGMDGINDVYKFLGYRVHISPDEIADCDKLACAITNEYLPGYMKSWQHPIHPTCDDLIDYDELSIVSARCQEMFKPVIDEDQFRSRIRVGYVVQKVLEDVITKYLSKFKFSNLIVTGGCFYNVRLNDKLRSHFSHATFCAMPLAGDQGAPLGLAYADYRWVKFAFADLFWGKRELSGAVVNDYLIDVIADQISRGVIVNVLQGDMEFGPRSLCNTATLALCRSDLIDAINTANGRTTVMPCAPVMLARHAVELFDVVDLTRTIGSDQYMITAHNYDLAVLPDELGGAMHRDIDGSYSGRPQIVFDTNSFIFKLLDRLSSKYGVRAIVNTSLNIHGQPIIYDSADLEKLTNFWEDHCPLTFDSYVIG